MGRRHKGGGRRTIIVTWLRVILPLSALMLLSTLFLFSGRPDPEAALPYAEIDEASLTAEPVMSQPRWAGVTPDGAMIGLSASKAATNSQGETAIETMRLEWTGPHGTTAIATAPLAKLDEAGIGLSGGVAVQTSARWTLHAAEVFAALDKSEITAEGGIRAVAPLGNITADSARLHNPDPKGEGGNEILDFAGNVRLIYQP